MMLWLFALIGLAQTPLPDTTPRPGLSNSFAVYWAPRERVFICFADCYTPTRPDGGLWPNRLRAEDGNAQVCIDKLRTQAAANCGR